jgi:uncharacterized RDD family membrane protein YckC
MKNQDLFAGDYNIDTPERVAFDYTIADVGNRFLAAFLDMLLVAMALVGLNALLIAALDAAGVSSDIAFDSEGIGWGAGLLLALYAMLNFLVFWGYFTLLEWKWNGQTVGKAAMHLRVVRVDGSPAGGMEIAVRNLVRIVDFLPSGYLLGLGVMLANPQARRLGDLAGGTLVVKADRPVTLDELVRGALAMQARPTVHAPIASAPAAAPVVAGPTSAAAHMSGEAEGDSGVAAEDQPASTVPDAPASPLPGPGLDIRGLRASDYTLILDVLGRDATQPVQDVIIVRLATAVAAKIGYTGDVSDQPRVFLQRVAEAYRRKG